MKTIILLSLITITAVSCDDEDPYITPDLYSGHYSFESPDIDFEFGLIREYGIYKGVSGYVSHPAISATEGRDSLVLTRNRTESGYDHIIIRSSETGVWSLDLVDVVFVKDGANVGAIVIQMPGQDDQTLNGVFLRKSDL